MIDYADIAAALTVTVAHIPPPVSVYVPAVDQTIYIEHRAPYEPKVTVNEATMLIEY